MEHYGLISIIPPILAILLALKTKNIIVSLFFALYLGAIALADWNPVKAFANLIPNFIYEQVASDSNMQSITNLCIIGGFVALISASGWEPQVKPVLSLYAVVVITAVSMLMRSSQSRLALPTVARLFRETSPPITVTIIMLFFKSSVAILSPLVTMK